MGVQDDLNSSEWNMRRTEMDQWSTAYSISKINDKCNIYTANG